MPKRARRAPKKKKLNPLARNTWRRFVVTDAEDADIKAGHAAAQSQHELGREYRLMTYLRDAVLRCARFDAKGRSAA